MDNISKSILIDGNMLFYIALIVLVILASIVLLFISRSLKIGLKKYWGEIEILQNKRFFFFIAKASAYRRILYFFTFISYGLRILSVLTTFFIIYCLVDKSKFSNALLVFAALCDGINLLFPFQRYVDLFSECCIRMEESILKNNTKLINTNQEEESTLITEIYNDMSQVYIECEHLIHTQNKI